MIYVVIILLLMVCVYLYDYRRMRSYKNVVLNILLCVFTLLAGLRYRIGTDTISYMDFFDTVPNLLDLRLSDFSNTRYAPLAFLSFSLVKTFSSSFVVYQLMISFIVNYSVIRFIKKYGKDGFIFIFLLMYFLTSYYMLNCEVLRESFAICVFLYSIDYLLNNKIFKYFVLCFIATLFHYGAAILFVLPLILKIRINKYSLLILIILYFCAFTVRDNLFVLNYLGALIGLSDLIGIYTDSALNRDYSLLNLVGFVVYIFLPLISFIYVNKDNRFNICRLDHLFYFYLLTLVVSRSVWIFSRYSNNYFGFFELYYYSCFIYILFFKLKRYISGFLLLFILLIPRLFYSCYLWNNDFYELAYPGFKKIEIVYPYTNYITNKKTIQEREVFYRVLNK